MKNNLTLFLAFISAIVIVLPACEKESDPPAAKTKTQLIMQGSWSFDKAMSGSTDISSQVPACYKDNIITFTTTTNGTVTNTVVCTPSDPTPATFTWSWQNGETVLALNAPLFPGGSGSFNLNSLTETSLVVNQDVTFSPNPTINVTFYYKH